MKQLEKGSKKSEDDPDGAEKAEKVIKKPDDDSKPAEKEEEKP